MSVCSTGRIVALPDLSGVGVAISESIAVLDEIRAAFEHDLAEHQDHLVNVPGETPEAIVEFERFKIREVWRIGSFIVSLTTLHGIFEHHLSTLKKLHGRVASPEQKYALRRELRATGANEERKRQLDVAFDLRNRVFAHTEYGSTERKGDLSSRYTSLMVFSGNGAAISPDGIEIGAVSVVFGDPMTGNPNQAPPIPSVRMKGLLETATMYLGGWREMYMLVMRGLLSIPDDAWRKANPNFNRVYREWNGAEPLPSDSPG